MGYYSKTAVASRGEALPTVMEKALGPSTTGATTPSWGLGAYVPPKVTGRRPAATRSFTWLHIEC